VTVIVPSMIDLSHVANDPRAKAAAAYARNRRFRQRQVHDEQAERPLRQLVILYPISVFAFLHARRRSRVCVSLQPCRNKYAVLQKRQTIMKTGLFNMVNKLQCD
jgi:hypothetical protein